MLLPASRSLSYLIHACIRQAEKEEDFYNEDKDFKKIVMAGFAVAMMLTPDAFFSETLASARRWTKASIIIDKRQNLQDSRARTVR